jgi:hypothetical protein
MRVQPAFQDNLVLGFKRGLANTPPLLLYHCCWCRRPLRVLLQVARGRAIIPANKRHLELEPTIIGKSHSSSSSSIHSCTAACCQLSALELLSAVCWSSDGHTVAGSDSLMCVKGLAGPSFVTLMVVLLCDRPALNTLLRLKLQSLHDVEGQLKPELRVCSPAATAARIRILTVPFLLFCFCFSFVDLTCD